MLHNHSRHADKQYVADFTESLTLHKDSLNRLARGELTLE